MLWGVGAHSDVRDQHIAAGGQVVMWDIGYLCRAKVNGYMRVSIDQDHPQHLLDRAPLDDSRWRRLGIDVRNDYDPDGPIVLVGLGKKQRQYRGAGWEEAKYLELLERFPDRRIVYRPKPNSEPADIACEMVAKVPIEDVLRGASLVVCRHSNVAVDAVIAGIPFEAEDGAATWLRPGVDRMEFLARLAWFQWRPCEMREAWRFVCSLV